MNDKVVLGGEVALILIYLTLVIFVFDTSKILGLVEVGVLTLLVFPVVLMLEKKREQGKNMVEESTEMTLPTGAIAASPAPANPINSQPPQQLSR